MNNELIKKTIAITGFDSASYDGGGTKTVILSNKDKYFFYNKTKDGNLTKAQEGYDTLRPRIGDTVEVMVSEIPDTFVNKQGKTINYTKRRIMSFNVNGAQMEARQTPAPRSTSQPASPASVERTREIMGNNTQLDRIESLLKDIAASLGAKAIIGTQAAKSASISPAPIGTMHDGKDEMYPDIPTVSIDDIDSEIRIEEVPF